MALFKILKGDSARIDTSVTPFHDGYAYFTPDNGGFYIDSEDNGVQRRIRINEELYSAINNKGDASSSVNTALAANGWVNGQQIVFVAGLGANQNGIVGLAQSCTAEEYESAVEASLTIIAQSNESLTFAANGEVPQINIPISVILLG